MDILSLVFAQVAEPVVVDSQVDYYAARVSALLTEYGLKLLGALAIFFVGKWLARKVTNLSKSGMTRSHLDPTLISFAGNFIYAILLIVVILAALELIGVKTMSFVAILGAAGLAIGLALQGSLSNFAAGVMMIIFRHFKVGDFVVAGGETGTIREIGIFNTIMVTPNNQMIILPNAKITSGNITNFSAMPTRRIDFRVGVSYSDDLKHVRSVLEQVTSECEKALPEPAITIQVVELGDSSVDFAVRIWVNSPDYWSTLCWLTETVKTRFDQEGISIPFPQRDVHLFQEKS